MTNKVYIVGGDGGISAMFARRGWQEVRDPEDADFLQFTGGADVDPMLYFEPAHPRTNSDPRRDSREANLFNIFWGRKKMLGICRGGQFLNVMCGGTMWQDVNNHGISNTHPATDVETQEVFAVTSTHHQMMREADTGTVLLRAGLSTRKDDGWDSFTSDPSKMSDVEAILYKEANVLCFQPHPEYTPRDHPCQELYFHYINKHLGG